MAAVCSSQPVVERLRRDVVVVEHQRLVAAEQELGHRRRGTQLVEQHVARSGPGRVLLEVGGLVLQLVVGGLDVDVGLPSGGAEGVAQRTGVVPRGVTGQQRGHELVDGGHRSRVATTRYSVGPSSSSLMVSMAALTVAASSDRRAHVGQASVVAAPQRRRHR